MKTLSKAVAIASLVSASALTAQVANAEVSYNAALVTDYVFRGLSFSDQGPALQGGADYSHASGAYAGTWLSTTDDGEETGIEYDIYGGYAFEANGVDVDLGLTTYSYDEGGYDTTEVYAVLGKDALTASVYLDVDAYSTTYLSAGYGFALPEDIALDLAAGVTIPDESEADEVIDLSVSASKSFEVVDVAFTVTNIDAEVEDDTLFFLSVSKEF